MRKQRTPRRWWLDPLVILAHAYSGEGDAGDHAAIEKLVRWKRSMGFDAEHLTLNRTMLEGTEGGDDPAAYLFKNRHGYRDDWLARYLPVAHEHGLRVIVYFNCHWFRSTAFPPAWFLTDRSGEPAVFYGSGGGVCPRGPFRQWSAELAEDLGRYPVDGVFLDGPSQQRCFCPTCRAEFEEQHGRPVPASAADCPAGLSDAFAAFPADAAIGYVRAFARALRSTNPNALLYINDISSGDGTVMRETADVTQLVGSEGGFVGYRPLEPRFPFSAGITAKELEARAGRRGRVVFCDCGYKSFDYHAHPKAEIARMYAGTVANGANTWFLVLRDAQETEGIQMALRFNRLIADNRDALANGDSLARAALFHSPLNRRLAGPAREAADDISKREAGLGRLTVPRHASEYEGLYAALARSGYPFDVIEEQNLLDGLPARIRLVILPAVGAMSDATAGALRRFVRRGGSLLATFDSSLFDERGNRRPDYLLADVFGASVTGSLFGPSKLDYLAVTEDNDLARGTSQAVLPCPEYWWHVKPKRDARPLLFYREKMPRRYASLTAVSPVPAALLHRFGRGRALLIPSAIGDHYRNWTLPDQRILIANAARMLAAPPLEIDPASEFVETTLRRGRNGSLVLHLVNWASGTRPATGAVPLGPLRIAVNLPPRFVPRCVESRLRARRLRFALDGRVLRFSLPRLEEYEMILITPKDR